MTDLDTTRESINRETAKIQWQELEKHFASGALISVDPSLDLIEAAYQITCDNKTQVEQWMDSALLKPVADTEATTWQQANQTFWAVVIKPWILIQPLVEKP